jgi:hypothetical protein
MRRSATSFWGNRISILYYSSRTHSRQENTRNHIPPSSETLVRSFHSCPLNGKMVSLHLFQILITLYASLLQWFIKLMKFSISLVPLLNWRARNGSERTKHTTITNFRLKQLFASLAFVKHLAGIDRHSFHFLKAALWTGDYRVQGDHAKFFRYAKITG